MGPEKYRQFMVDLQGEERRALTKMGIELVK